MFSLTFVFLLAGFGKNYSTDFHKIRRKVDTWATEEMSTNFGGNPDQHLNPGVLK